MNPGDRVWVNGEESFATYLGPDPSSNGALVRVDSDGEIVSAAWQQLEYRDEVKE